MSRDREYYRLDIEVISLYGVVERNFVGVVVVAVVGCLDVNHIATFVMTLARLAATILVVGACVEAVSIAGECNSSIAAYPYEIYRQQCCYLHQSLHNRLLFDKVALAESLYPRLCIALGKSSVDFVGINENVCHIFHLELLALQLVPK